jgi:ADP-ribose pyrophosphatase YjhB (NUDIX family)
MTHTEDADVRIDDIQSRGIILKDNMVLVMYRKKDGEEYYVFPGGHMREGETPLETAVREIEEETTIKVRDMELAFKFTNYVKPSKVKIDYYFLGYWESGEPVLSGEESRRDHTNDYYEPMWAKLEDIHKFTLYTAAAKEWVEYDLKKFIDKRTK